MSKQNAGAVKKEMTYVTEGYIKSITKASTGLNFTLEVVAPYLFESKEKKDDGSARRKILLVIDDEHIARIHAESVGFQIDDLEFTALLIAKANHMKVRLSVDENAIEQIPLVVSELEML